MLPRHDLISRALAYARETQIDFITTPRMKSWTRFSLPDLRGFCPHLRRVNLFFDQAEYADLSKLEEKCRTELTEGKAGEGLWLIHDILHIAFYDFASSHLKEEAWATRERFIENHLASEFFAVFLLDYRFLIFTDVHGLTVDLDATKWNAFQKLNPSLPALESTEFSRGLFDLYFTGKSHFESAQSKKIDSWLGHELRYTQKQRRYVVQWWDDLQGLLDSRESAEILGSEVIHPVMELVHLFLNANEREWKAFLKKGPGKKNYFSQMVKYKRSIKAIDYRFSDIQSVEREFLLKDLGEKAPSSSQLFLFWQILSTISPSRFDRRTLNDISSVAQESNEGDPTVSSWEKLNSLIRSIFTGPHYKDPEKRPEAIATFFLP